MELFKFYPAVPPNGKSNLGSTLVECEGVKVWFSFTYECVMLPDGSVYPDSDESIAYVHDISLRYAKAHIKAHIDGKIVIAPECFYTPSNEHDQRPVEEQRKAASQPSSNQAAQFVNQGYKIKRMVDEDKVYYEIAFRMSSGKESQFPAKIFNESYLKMLAKALSEAGHEPHKWESGKPHYINIEFGVSKSDKVGENGKAFNNYQYFKVLPDTATDEPSSERPF